MKALLDYQEADVQFDKLEADLRNSAASKRLNKVRQFLEEQKRVLKKMSAAADVRRQTIDSTAERFDVYEKRYKDGMEKFENADKETPEELQKYVRYFEQLTARIAAERREFAQLVTALEKEDHQLSEMRIRIAKMRKEYDELKAKVEAEREAGKAGLEKAKVEAEKLEALVEVELLSEYKRVKRNHAIPVVEVNGSKCTGCNMELPAVSTRKLKEQEMVECDNCGRILYLPKEEDEDKT